jgi:prepilin-type N-terminal cleavage/methylation domain-containing protein
MNAPTSGPRRPGFTLAEILTVVSIIVLLAAATLAFLPNFAEQQKASRGADQLQQWLFMAKQWALRDQAPRGLRLIPDPQTGLVRDLRYVEQPDDFIVQQFQNGQPQVRALGITQPPYNVATLQGNQAQPGFTGTSPDRADWPVQPGDYLQLQGGQVNCIQSVSPLQLTLQDPVGTNPVGPTTQYRIIRRPRLTPNQEPLQLPRDVVIDLRVSLPSQNAPYGPVDVVFAPNEAVIGGSAATDRICLWVWDTAVDQPPNQAPTNGGPTLVTVYTHSGMIAAHPVNPDPTLGGPPPNHYYYFTRDPRASGL